MPYSDRESCFSSLKLLHAVVMKNMSLIDSGLILEQIQMMHAY